MTELVLALATLACPATMIVMMLVTMRSHAGAERPPEAAAEDVVLLREETSVLRRDIAESPHATGVPETAPTIDGRR